MEFKKGLQAIWDILPICFRTGIHMIVKFVSPSAFPTAWNVIVCPVSQVASFPTISLYWTEITLQKIDHIEAIAVVKLFVY